MSVEKKAWEGFSGRIWKEEVNVRDFIQNNYKPYDGDESFMACLLYTSFIACKYIKITAF